MSKISNEKIVMVLRDTLDVLFFISIAAAFICFITDVIPSVYGLYLAGGTIIFYVSIRLFLATIETLFEIRDLLKKT